MRRFRVEFSSEVIIEIADEVIAVVDDEWRGKFYKLYTPEDIAQHVAYHLIINGVGLSRLVGFADKSDHQARIAEQPDWDIEATEL